MERDKSNVNFNLTPEQQEKFNSIYKGTKELYPHLVADDVSKVRIKALIAYTVINGDDKLIELQNNKIFYNDNIDGEDK